MAVERLPRATVVVALDGTSDGGERLEATWGRRLPASASEIPSRVRTIAPDERRRRPLDETATTSKQE